MYFFKLLDYSHFFFIKPYPYKLGILCIISVMVLACILSILICFNIPILSRFSCKFSAYENRGNESLKREKSKQCDEQKVWLLRVNRKFKGLDVICFHLSFSKLFAENHIKMMLIGSSLFKPFPNSADGLISSSNESLNYVYCLWILKVNVILITSHCKLVSL